MSCLHRFHEELLPKHPVEILFIGTFNPIWDVKKGDNSDYFYSRNANQFWCILPHALGKKCIVDKARNEKEKFCVANKIGLSDLIYCIENVNESDSNSTFLKKGFKDEDFERKNESRNYELEITFLTDKLKVYIKKHKGTLKSVFLTRKTSTGIPRIWEQWLFIKALCAEYKITVGELPSPSPRGGGIRDKINVWRSAINNSQ